MFSTRGHESENSEIVWTNKLTNITASQVNHTDPWRVHDWEG